MRPPERDATSPVHQCPIRYLMTSPQVRSLKLCAVGGHFVRCLTNVDRSPITSGYPDPNQPVLPQPEAGSPVDWQPALSGLRVAPPGNGKPRPLTRSTGELLPVERRCSLDTPGAGDHQDADVVPAGLPLPPPGHSECGIQEGQAGSAERHRSG